MGFIRRTGHWQPHAIWHTPPSVVCRWSTSQLAGNMIGRVRSVPYFVVGLYLSKLPISFRDTPLTLRQYFTHRHSNNPKQYGKMNPTNSTIVCDITTITTIKLKTTNTRAYFMGYMLCVMYSIWHLSNRVHYIQLQNMSMPLIRGICRVIKQTANRSIFPIT